MHTDIVVVCLTNKIEMYDILTYVIVFLLPIVEFALLLLQESGGSQCSDTGEPNPPNNQTPCTSHYERSNS